MTDITKLSDSAREELRARLYASLLACNAARARGDERAADQAWKEHISLLMGEMRGSKSPQPPFDKGGASEARGDSLNSEPGT